MRLWHFSAKPRGALLPASPGWKVTSPSSWQKGITSPLATSCWLLGTLSWRMRGNTLVKCPTPWGQSVRTATWAFYSPWAVGRTVRLWGSSPSPWCVALCWRLWSGSASSTKPGRRVRSTASPTQVALGSCWGSLWPFVLSGFLLRLDRRVRSPHNRTGKAVGLSQWFSWLGKLEPAFSCCRSVFRAAFPPLAGSSERSFPLGNSYTLLCYFDFPWP